ncbi:MAG TPA: N-acetylglucosamine-6-phosphate deacetylase [Clostridia bacterium]|nr:N-acetylglucosamine-6-phosphate deacetylase [Clostridia bacterium]HPQ46044.1 N-acetylglucosamine-6-phosphate deacetylase [Clostridia bacterium]HRX42185.1 N-acetylglucosamine-6-phosphate deacetylase [Clostridia bacterium]
MSKLLTNCRVFDGEKFLDGLWDIFIEDGRIQKISGHEGNAAGTDCEGRVVSPGYVDIHTHGIAGFDNSDIKAQDFDAMCSAYHRTGTTCFIPTFPTIDRETASQSLEIYKKKREKIESVHLEGPFINKEKKGAQNPDYILEPDVDLFDDFAGEYEELIGRVTLSPEMDSGFRLTKKLVSKGILVSFGHTSCSFEKGMEFFGVTDSLATHMFNAMPAIHHREPGITVASLLNSATACEIIPDMIHLHPAIIKLIYKLKGPVKTICVSDSIMAAGLPDGEYVFSGLGITVMNKSARLKSGNLAGSIITMAEGVRNLVSIGIAPEDALMSATSSPAFIMGIEERHGFLKPGRVADIVVLEEDYSVNTVLKAGERVI